LSVVGVVDGFKASVAFEGGFVFSWGWDFVQVGEWGEGDEFRCSGGEVAELAGIGGGDVESHGWCYLTPSQGVLGQQIPFGDDKKKNNHK
jgi:hypothetical protein